MAKEKIYIHRPGAFPGREAGVVNDPTPEELARARGTSYASVLEDKSAKRGKAADAQKGDSNEPVEE